MQDIIPPHRPSRGNLRPPTRADSPQPQRLYYSRRVQVVSDMVTGQTLGTVETVQTETIFRPDPAPMTRGIEHLSPAAKALTLERALNEARKSLKSERRKSRDLKRFGLVFVASVFILVTGYVSIDTIMTNNRVKAETDQSSSAAVIASKDEEGKDETVPGTDILSKYLVAPSLPRALYIDKIDVAARVLPMGVNNDGSIQAPRNIFDAGWYNGSVKPGEIGAMFIDAHASGATREGLFASIDQLVEGDTLQIEKGDGSRLTYKVTHTEVVGLDDVDMKKVLLPHGNALRALNLMTCTGAWVEGKQTYDQRVIVYAEQV
jgi:LPXTG-site transpeptidase (sortase) family protein